MHKNGQLMIKHKTDLRYFVLICLTFLLCSCMSTDKSSEKQPRKQVYIDANLMFEISYPEEWVRIKRSPNLTPLTRQTTTWQISDQQSRELLLELSIISIPAERNPFGHKGLKTIINEQHNNLIIEASEETILPAGPARKISGQTQHITYDFWLYIGRQRHYIVTCSAAATAFELHQEQFQQIVDSFKPFK